MHYFNFLMLDSYMTLNVLIYYSRGNPTARLAPTWIIFDKCWEKLQAMIICLTCITTIYYLPFIYYHWFRSLYYIIVATRNKWWFSIEKPKTEMYIETFLLLWYNLWSQPNCGITFSILKAASRSNCGAFTVIDTRFRYTVHSTLSIHAFCPRCPTTLTTVMKSW